MADNMYIVDYTFRNRNVVKLSEQIQEFNAVNNEGKNIRDLKEKMIKD